MPAPPRVERVYAPDLERAARALLVLLTKRGDATGEVVASEEVRVDGALASS